ncbi:DNA cytosine methyltransferase [Mycoplasmopsis caviae]|uniref:DNA (cytosine-5-)-methyltransferase n=1 Tax=Mycoplasmopsis caviae TaxID=55603 RepID=A0A3P8MDV9_9BACT|nr:DNA cytosine methyltransferase [Mycoplasmopsis caviae]UUD34848.1 DNA cytosine methyltransferase [Mycoplasmopsis caviae]VDR42300.1 cytosine-specific methyltransferase [Mycoplasmopsis caviae]
MINNKPTYISLFSSAGVGCYGFKQEQFECVATNEVLSKRLNIQRLNKKCKYESGYIVGDIKRQETKDLIYQEIKKWSKIGNDKIDVVIATPPCQGMSVANHSKSENDLERNSLIRESVNLIKEIKPRFFVFENVPAFWKTGCINNSNEIVAIGEFIQFELNCEYTIHKEVINFKNYGSNSSRNRTIVIGVNKSLCDEISPIELFPDYKEEKTLFETIGNLTKLNWGEYDQEDFFHSFRTYPKNMEEWISELKQGESAFDNIDPFKRPHKLLNGKIIPNTQKNSNKYTRQYFDKVGPCIHTRSDQLASQNTIHPSENRVFSIRELMKMMTIPYDFKWIDIELNELNSLSYEEKKKISKKEELNIRQSIGEAVPTIIFRQIANKIKNFLLVKGLSIREIKKLIKDNELNEFKNLKDFVIKNKKNYNLSTLMKIIELANNNKVKNSAYFTNKFIIQKIYDSLPTFEKECIKIIEPSVGIGNFLPFLLKKYQNHKKVTIFAIDIDEKIIELLKIIFSPENIPSNFEINFICSDFMLFNPESRVDLIVGNPPFTKVEPALRKKYLLNNKNQKSTNLAEFILEKSILLADYVSLIMPKNLLNTPEYIETRNYLLNSFGIENIIDFGEFGFSDVSVETINIIINTNKKCKETKIVSLIKNIQISQKSDYIFDNNLPYWVIYRDKFFDSIFSKMKFGVFNVFRDRQVTNSLISSEKNDKWIPVLKSRNINNDGEIINVKNYDSFIKLEDCKKLNVSRFLDDTSVYLTPNMTYNPRLIRKEKGYIVNGSIAILIPKSKNIELSKEQMMYISSDEFSKFYRIARNYQTRSLNIDNLSCFWFGIKKEI